jgi:long-subunit fatty acid transport protein
LLGDEAAMTGGAGVAVSRDSGSLWYNPAGLGGLKLGRMELSGTVYQAKFRKIEGYLETDLPGGRYTADVGFNDFGSVPTALVFVRNINEKISAGIGWYQTNDSWVEFRTDIQAPVGVDDAQWTQGVEYHQRAYTLHIGPAFGIEINPRFRIGASLFFTYHSYTASFTSFAAVEYSELDEEDSYYTLGQNAYIGSIGTMLQVGLQAQVSDHWHLGVVLRSPEFEVVAWHDKSRNGSGVIEDSANIDVEPGFQYRTDEGMEWGFSPTQALEGQIAVAYKTAKMWIGGEVAVRPPLTSQDLRFLWNASIGGRYQFTETLNWGAGLFTDNSPNKKPENLLEVQVNRYGVSTGLEFKTPLMTRSKNGKKEKKLVWATTVAAIYSLEVGSSTIIHYDYDSPEGFEFPTKNIVLHHVMAHLGTALYF